MKKLFLTLTACILTLGLWADTSITEKFTRVSQTGSSGNIGSAWTGDLCGWQNVNARRKSSDQINSEQATWITVGYTTDETPVYVPGYIKTTNLEGGIKKVSFKYAQFGAEAATTLKWRVSAIGETTSSDVIERDGDDGGNGGTGAGLSYAHSFNFKGNAQLEIYNASVMENGNNPAAGKARLLVGDITITPYLLYRNKDVTVGLKQRGYANNGSQDFINNTGNEGSIEFSSSNTAVATVDPETGVITPVSVGDAIITATWSEGANTTYTLHVVDGIIAENFSKVVQTGQTTSATWNGDLWDWSVANVRRGEADTLGLSPRIQGTAMRSNTGSTLIPAEKVEGGVKHLAFDWRQWASGNGNLNMKIYYSANLENWGEAVAIQSEAAVKASEPHVFDKDIDDGAKGNAYMKLEYTADGGVAILGAMKITPWLLYTTKEATLDTRGTGALSYTNPDLIDNTGSTVTYTIEDYDGIPTDKIEINSSGTITVADRYQSGDITVQAKWSEVTTTYTLHVIGKASANAHFTNEEENKTLLDIMFNNPVIKEAGSADATYESSNTDVATVAGASVTIKGAGDAVITATIPENDNFQGAVVSYTLHVAAPDFYVAGDFTSWGTNKIPVYGNSYTIQDLSATSHELKVIESDGSTWKGFSDLTTSEVIAGLYGNGSNNICFTLAEAGDVTVTYTNEEFKLAGDFTPQTVQFGGSWTSDWADGKITAVLSADKKSATATKTFTVDEDGNKNWYNFKPIINGSWLGCEAGATGVTRSSLTVSGFTTVDNNNHIYFQADEEGEYKFTWVFGTNTFVFTFPPTTPTAIDETNASVKAVKNVVNGQLIIEKNGVRYNVLGQAL